jgi:hypothetical protein
MTMFYMNEWVHKKAQLKPGLNIYLTHYSPLTIHHSPTSLTKPSIPQPDIIIQSV